MTTPLVVLSVFAIGYGWVGIPEHFPLLGGLLPNWFHGFVGATLLEEPEALTFNIWPLLTSLVVALGGLTLGWFVYKDVKAGQTDPLEKPLGALYPVLKNKWYFDEFYDYVVVKPMNWVSEVFTPWMDRTVIDGILHSVARLTLFIGFVLRNYFDKPIINELIGDGTAEIFWRGQSIRYFQTGRIQSYLIGSVGVLIVIAAILYYFL
jgi:NADH-quinone oxidoreductase subunit L